MFFDLDIAASGLPAAAALLLLGTVSITACGFVLASLVPSRNAASALGLGILFLAAFISNVFVAGQMPSWLDTVGALLPLKHLAHSLVTVLDPTGPSVSWTGVAVMMAWLVLAALLDVRLFQAGAIPVAARYAASVVASGRARVGHIGPDPASTNGIGWTCESKRGTCHVR